MIPPAMPPSLWAATARPAAATPPLGASRRADVVIVGAGYTGLVTALHLAAGGADVVVLDAAEPGWGASGRNGGQVIPGLKYDPDDLIGRFGPERGEALATVAGAAADEVFDLIARHDIACDARRSGWIQPAHAPSVLTGVLRRAEQWARRGADVEILDRAAMADRLGSPAYLGGWVDRRAGSIQPLSYLRGLVRAGLAQGVAIHGTSPVAAVRRDAGTWQVTTAAGPAVTADRVLIATNGYTGDLWPGLRRTVIAANSFLVATQPLPPDRAGHILRGGEVASDSRRLLLYFRRDAQGRLLMGGRGPFADPARPADFAHLERSVALLFPDLGPIAFDYRWAGRVALTRDFMPHVHEPAPGLTIALGYNGRGIALATAMGRHLARRMAGGPDREFPFPITPIVPIPFHFLQRFYIAAGVAWYGLMDRLA